MRLKMQLKILRNKLKISNHTAEQAGMLEDLDVYRLSKWVKLNITLKPIPRLARAGDFQFMVHGSW